MARKIDGKVSRRIAYRIGVDRVAPSTIEFYTKDHMYQEGDEKATLVISEEAVFTESEVKEILRDAIWGRMTRPKQEHMNRFIVHSGGL